jgi:hypothetical protein
MIVLNVFIKLIRAQDYKIKIYFKINLKSNIFIDKINSLAALNIIFLIFIQQ